MRRVRMARWLRCTRRVTTEIGRMEPSLNNETRREMTRRAREPHDVMKKLDALVAGFADEVFRTIRGATLEELAELLGAEPAPERSQQRTVTRATSGTHRPAWSPSRKPGAERRTRQLGIFDDLQGSPEAQVVAEITDPERLLRLESDASAAPDHAPAGPAHAASAAANHRPLTVVREPAPETPPPVSTEKPVSSAPVLLRANEALVRASNAGIVIRRRKGA